MRARRAILVLATVAVAVATPLSAGAAASSSGVASAGSIAGTVTGQGDVPLTGACVSLVTENPVPSPVTTDGEGHYSFAGLLASPIDGYVVEVDPSCSSSPEAPDYSTFRSSPAYVQAGQTVTVDAKLVLGGSARGVVLDANGNSQEGACVGAYATSDQGLIYPQGYTQSGSDGSYVLRGLAPGQYRVVIDGCYDALHTGVDIQPEYYLDGSADGTQTDGGTVIAVVAGQTVQLSDQRARPGADIELSINAGSTPADLIYPNVIPFEVGTSLNGYGSVEGPDAYGFYRITKLLPGSYKIGYSYCSDPSPRSCRNGFIGYYAGVGVDGNAMQATAIPTATGVTTDITDTVSVPPLIQTNTTVSTEQASVPVGQVITVYAHVTAVAGTHVPAGNVYFSDLDAPNEALGMSGVDTTGLAVFFWTAAAGTHRIVASYSGDGGTDISSGQVTIIDGRSSSPSAGGGGGSGGGGGGGSSGGGAPVSGTVGAGGSLSSDPAGTTPDASNPLVVSVTSPAGGDVSIDKTAPNTTVSHYKVLNVGATITAPTASVSNPLKLSFQVFDGQLPRGSYVSDLMVFRDGVPVAACTKAGTATPDPCVASTSTSNGVTTNIILSSHASTWDVEAAQVGRIGGADRIGTAVAVSKDSFPAGGAGAVVLARADDYPDALVGAPLAAAKNAPLLLTQGAQLPKATSDEIMRVLPSGGTVYVLGGTAAVPDSAVTQLKNAGFTVVRYAGADRYATAVAVAGALGDPGTVLLATGANFPDALAAGPAAAHVQGAVLLTDGATLSTATSAYLAAHPGTVYAVGGPAAKADPAATPVVGVDRYATAADLAAKLFANPGLVGVATGTSFPDALSGGAQLAGADGPLLLATPTGVPGPTSGYLGSVKNGLDAVHLFGGPNALTDNVTTQLKNVL